MPWCMRARSKGLSFAGNVKRFTMNKRQHLRRVQAQAVGRTCNHTLGLTPQRADVGSGKWLRVSAFESKTRVQLTGSGWRRPS